MIEKLLICTDLDRTLIENGEQPASVDALARFKALASRHEVSIAYVTGRDRCLVEQAIVGYQLPTPDYVVADVGSSIYQIDTNSDWQLDSGWERAIATDWQGHSHAEIQQLLREFTVLHLQEAAKQNRYKLSYYLNLDEPREILFSLIRDKLASGAIRSNLIWSVDEATATGLLDILPQQANKFHAIEYLMQTQGFDLQNTVFSGDSGNDLEVLCSPIAATLVANAHPEVKSIAIETAQRHGLSNQLYRATGDFLGMNGNYAAGILEGIAHYHPHTLEWMTI
jgi:sucrose-6F-phosphate phosphohydrolase